MPTGQAPQGKKIRIPYERFSMFWRVAMIKRAFPPGTFALTALLGTLTALGPLSTDLYLPSLPSIGRAFGADAGRVQLTLSTFVAGFACGLPFYGPLSDRLGRRRVMLVGLITFMIACLGAAMSNSLEMLLACRFLQGIGTAGPAIIARSVVRDLYAGPRAAQELGRMGSIMALVPLAAPMLGVVFEITWGWRANFFASAALVALLGFIMFRHLPETLTKPLDQPFSAGDILKDYADLIRDRRFWPYGVLVASTYAGLLCFLSSSSFLIQGYFGHSHIGFALLFSMIVIAYLAGSMLSQHLAMRHSARAMLMTGGIIQAIAGLMAPLAVAVAPMSAFSIIVPMMLYQVGMGFTLPQSMANAMMPFPDRAGTASSLLTVIQQAGAAIVVAVMSTYIAADPAMLAMVMAFAGMGALAAQFLIRLEKA